MNLKDYKENNKMLSEEYFGWIGNGIFLSAQLLQVFHTFVVKKTNDLSFGQQIFSIIGNSMYTAFGFLDRSDSMFIGSAASLVLGIIQVIQKIHYDRINRQETQYLLDMIN